MNWSFAVPLHVGKTLFVDPFISLIFDCTASLPSLWLNKWKTGVM